LSTSLGHKCDSDDSCTIASFYGWLIFDESLEEIKSHIKGYMEWIIF